MRVVYAVWSVVGGGYGGRWWGGWLGKRAVGWDKGTEGTES